MAEKKYGGSAGTPIHLRTNAPRQTENQRYDYADDNPRAWKVEKTPTSAVRLDRFPRRETTTLPDPKKTRVMRERRFDRWTLVICVCLLFMVMVGGWWLFSTLANWWTNWQDDLHYGNPRTFQVDQFVGQGDSPDHPDHFIVVNAHGRVIVIQLNLQHPELDQTYGITTADPNTPVSLNFRPTGTTWAMYVVIEDTPPYSVELVSNGKRFVSPH
jgi:hypothetical protein